MTEITAAAVKALRDRTGLPMMKVKQALIDAGGDADKAVEILRKEGEKFKESRGDRVTSEGRIAVFADWGQARAAMVELQCESAPVAGNDEFVQLANDMAQQLALGPGAANAEELLAQPSPSKPGQMLKDQFVNLTNRIREVFNVPRILRIDGTCGAYAHFTGKSAVLVEVRGGDPEAAKDVCMHVVALRPAVLKVEDLDPDVVAKEKEILSAAARKEGKPENIIEKMVQGRLRNFYAEQVLLEQPFVKDEKKTVGKFAAEHGMEILRFVHWQLGIGG